MVSEVSVNSRPEAKQVDRATTNYRVGACEDSVSLQLLPLPCHNIPQHILKGRLRGRPALAKGGGPSSDSVRIPSQGLRRTPSGPSLGQQPDGVPSFPLPGCRRQNKPPVQVPGIHPPLFEKPLYLSHTHYQPLSYPKTD